MDDGSRVLRRGTPNLTACRKLREGSRGALLGSDSPAADTRDSPPATSFNTNNPTNSHWDLTSRGEKRLEKMKWHDGISAVARQVLLPREERKKQLLALFSLGWRRGAEKSSGRRKAKQVKNTVWSKKMQEMGREHQRQPGQVMGTGVCPEGLKDTPQGQPF